MRRLLNCTSRRWASEHWVYPRTITGSNCIWLGCNRRNVTLWLHTVLCMEIIFSSPSFSSSSRGAIFSFHRWIMLNVNTSDCLQKRLKKNGSDLSRFNLRIVCYANTMRLSHSKCTETIHWVNVIELYFVIASRINNLFFFFNGNYAFSRRVNRWITAFNPECGGNLRDNSFLLLGSCLVKIDFMCKKRENKNEVWVEQSTI